EADEIGAVHGESPFGRAVRAIGREPEDGDAGEEAELLFERRRAREVRRKLREPGVEREIGPRSPDDGKDQRWQEDLDGARDEHGHPRRPRMRTNRRADSACYGAHRPIDYTPDSPSTNEG